MAFQHAALAITIGLVCTVQGKPADPQRAAQAGPGRATITGTVVTLSSGEPIAGASVDLYEPALPEGRISTTTDTQGRFEFSHLTPGRYTVGATKTGFVNVTFGERRYGRGGRAMPLREGEHRDIRLQLPRPSAIAGTIIDEHGSAVVGASVRALRLSMSFGFRRADTAGSGITDHAGAFRIPSLTPGEYAVCASTRQTAPLNEGRRLRMEIDGERRSAAYVLGPRGVEAQRMLAPRLAELEARLPPFLPPVRGYAPVCYPGSASPLSMVAVAPEENRTGIDMRLTAVPLARIAGRVIGMPADNMALDPIRLSSADALREGPPADSTRPDFDGRFALTNVPPGRYRLFVRSTDARSAAAEIVVEDKDISNVILDLEPSVTVSGRVVFRGSVAPSAAALGAMEVRLDSVVLGPIGYWSGPFITRPDATGRFVLRAVFPGTYRISVSQRQVTDWFFDAAAIPGADVTGQLVEVKGMDVTGLTVTVTDQRAEVSGTIFSDKGEPAPEYFILLYPSDEKYWTPYSRRLLGTRAKQDGTFVIRGVQPGPYRLATLLDAEFGAWFNPAFLQGIDAGSMAVSIGRNEKKVLNLRVPGDR